MYLCDYTVTVRQPLHCQEPNFHERTKHIEINFNFVYKELQSGDLAISYFTSKPQPTNIFAKALDKKQFVHLRGEMGIIDPHALP